jgi:hypothetical protein
MYQFIQNCLSSRAISDLDEFRLAVQEDQLLSRDGLMGNCGPSVRCIVWIHPPHNNPLAIRPVEHACPHQGRRRGRRRHYIHILVHRWGLHIYRLGSPHIHRLHRMLVCLYGRLRLGLRLRWWRGWLLGTRTPP